MEQIIRQVMKMEEVYRCKDCGTIYEKKKYSLSKPYCSCDKKLLSYNEIVNQLALFDKELDAIMAKKPLSREPMRMLDFFTKRKNELISLLRDVRNWSEAKADSNVLFGYEKRVYLDMRFGRLFNNIQKYKTSAIKHEDRLTDAMRVKIRTFIKENCGESAGYEIGLYFNEKRGK